MISIEVFSEEKAWSKKLKKKELFFKEICNFFPIKYQFPEKKITLTLLLSNNKCIKKLNKKFRNKNKSTDILSFSLAKKILMALNSDLTLIKKEIRNKKEKLTWNNFVSNLLKQKNDK